MSAVNVFGMLQGVGEEKGKSLSHFRLFVTPWMVARQAPLSMEFSRQEYWSGLPYLSLANPPNPGIKSRSPTLRADSLPPEPPGKPSKSGWYALHWVSFLLLTHTQSCS